ncbi:MAG TPA: NUDIX domain-containing protein [Solirubrobacteraceae bacterium]|jgi:8-oxo-dGTP pyrophosphatase MutT (NUDIX family)|nr:NUDIX domain-containing protein [Solirubrobacteraceae bacterium]
MPHISYVDPATVADQVVAAVLVRDRRVLLCHRSAHRDWRPGTWDLPGGHVEPGEEATAALVRELREELAIVSEPPSAAPVRFAAGELDMHVWILHDWRGKTVNAAPDEHDELGWFGPGQVETLDLALAAYRDLIARAVC